MRKEQKMDASARKFLARRKLPYSFFEQKPLKSKPILKITVTENWLVNLAKHITLAMAHAPSDLLKVMIVFSQVIPTLAHTMSSNVYFSTPAGGKNVLLTEKPEADVKQILTLCNTNSLNPGTVIRTVLTLCDGSVINALNGSLFLNITTDPALRCINDQFDDQCGSSQTNIMDTYVMPIVGVVAAGLFIYCCFKQCCCKKERPRIEDQPLIPQARFSDNTERFMARENAKAEQEEFRGNLVAGGAILSAISSCTLL